jgi:hypothetical protein
VTRLNIEHIREVHGEAGLGDAEHEAVWKTVDTQAVEGAYAVAPFVSEGLAASADDLESSAT